MEELFDKWSNLNSKGNQQVKGSRNVSFGHKAYGQDLYDKKPNKGDLSLSRKPSRERVRPESDDRSIWNRPRESNYRNPSRRKMISKPRVLGSYPTKLVHARPVVPRGKVSKIMLDVLPTTSSNLEKKVKRTLSAKPTFKNPQITGVKVLKTKQVATLPLSETLGVIETLVERVKPEYTWQQKVAKIKEVLGHKGLAYFDLSKAGFSFSDKAVIRKFPLNVESLPLPPLAIRKIPQVHELESEIKKLIQLERDYHRFLRSGIGNIGIYPFDYRRYPELVAKLENDSDTIVSFFKKQLDAQLLIVSKKLPIHHQQAALVLAIRRFASNQSELAAPWLTEGWCHDIVDEWLVLNPLGNSWEIKEDSFEMSKISIALSEEVLIPILDSDCISTHSIIKNNNLDSLNDNFNIVSIPSVDSLNTAHVREPTPGLGSCPKVRGRGRPKLGEVVVPKVYVKVRERSYSLPITPNQVLDFPTIEADTEVTVVAKEICTHDTQKVDARVDKMLNVASYQNPDNGIPNRLLTCADLEEEMTPLLSDVLFDSNNKRHKVKARMEEFRCIYCQTMVHGGTALMNHLLRDIRQLFGGKLAQCPRCRCLFDSPKDVFNHTKGCGQDFHKRPS
ncbi:hypothetical protein MXB_3441 [Myxobolus squamalis]|nr:hypothetical protein MXB_3441 [Myxobolus squamalis]